jgi:hypothetical protein
MKQEELRKHSKCSICGEGVAKSGLPIFSVVTFQRYGLDMRAIQRQDGLSAMLGGHHGLAAVMGPNEDMAKPLGGPVTTTVCETCLMKPRMLACLMETDETEDE